MVKSIAYSLSFACVLAFSACKNTNNNSTTSTSTQETTQPTSVEELESQGYKSLNDDITPSEVAMMHSAASSIVKKRIDDSNGKTWAALESGVWEYEFIFDGEMSKPGEYAGHWIDMDRSNKYEYGVNGEIKGGGTYHYSPETGYLLLVDNDVTVKPIEYEIKLSGDMMVFSGHSVYKDNGKQGRLKRLQERPQ